MIICSWNIRGLNNPLKQHEVVGLMKKYIMDIYGLLETKLLPSRVATLHKFLLRDWKYLSNADVASTARIVVFWNPCTVSGDLLASSTQALHLSVHNSCGVLEATSDNPWSASFMVETRTVSDRLRAPNFHS